MTASNKTAPRKPATTRKTRRATATTPPGASKTGIMTELLGRPGGTTLDELVRATGWQAHSVRGALAGALKKKGHTITSEKQDGVRRYRIEAPQ
jgi:hypothetical protein